MASQASVSADLKLRIQLATSMTAVATAMANMGYVGPVMARNFMLDVSHVQTLDQMCATYTEYLAVATSYINEVYAVNTDKEISN
jgi:hypothetical protein